MLPIVDAHLHFWDHSVDGLEWQWLDPAFDHAQRGGLSRLDQPRWAATELRAEVAAVEALGATVVKTVHVQSARPDDPALETRWLQQMGADEGWPDAIIAYCHLADPDAPRLIAAHARSSRFRGVRGILSTDAAVLDAGADGVHLAAIDASHRALASHDAVVEVSVTSDRFDAAIAIAERHPDVPVVVSHAGLAKARDDDYFARWRPAMSRFAAIEHASCKVSALAGGADPNWTMESIRRWILGCVEAFGPERCMFASNWPIEKLFGSYDRLVSAYLTVLDELTADERSAFFSGTAARVYRI